MCLGIASLLILPFLLFFFAFSLFVAPPRGSGNVAVLDHAWHQTFAIETRRYVLQVCNRLPADFVGAGLNINNRGEIVGASISSPGAQNGFPSAFLWQNGVMSDLNALVEANSPLHLATAFSINDVGQIAGFGFVTSGPNAGEVHAFLATPK